MAEFTKAVQRWNRKHDELLKRLKEVLTNPERCSEEQKYVMVLDHVRQVLGADTSQLSMTDITTLVLSGFTLGLREQESSVYRAKEDPSPWIVVNWVQVATRVLDRQGIVQELVTEEEAHVTK